MASSHSEQVEALRISVERLCQMAATQDVEKLSVERQAIERALEGLTTEADILRSERDDARTEASRAEFHLTATRELLEEGPDGYLITNNAGIITHANRAAQRMLGIAPEFLPRIFDVFSRGPGDPGQSHPGLGLGLSVVRDLIVKHGGTVTATSAGVGQGSEFMIRLPLDHSQELPSSAAEASPIAERSILIVEDNPDAAEALRMVLELEGHRVTIARDGRHAIEQTRLHPPNVALVDIGLPDIDGCEVGRTVRAQPGGERVYLVAISGHSAPADRDRALQAGFNSYLVKPVAPDALLEVIGQAPS